MPEYRFPTSVKWGYDYRDGFRHIQASCVSAALSHPKAIAASTERKHLQINCGDKWRFVTEHDL